MASVYSRTASVLLFPTVPLYLTFAVAAGESALRPCTGVLLAAPFVTLGTLLASRRGLSLAADAASLPGMLSGAIWNIGNICSVVAVHDPGVGLAIAYPIMQCGLFVAGIWGILLHQELKVSRRKTLLPHAEVEVLLACLPVAAVCHTGFSVAVRASQQ